MLRDLLYASLSSFLESESLHSVSINLPPAVQRHARKEVIPVGLKETALRGPEILDRRSCLPECTGLQ